MASHYIVKCSARNVAHLTMSEFCVDRCSDDWLDDFESLFLNLNINLGNACDWWNELGGIVTGKQIGRAHV